MSIWKIWKWDVGIFVAYVFLVFATTILGRKPFEGSHFQPELFWSWRVWDKQKEQILANIIMFIPIGIQTGRMWNWKGLLFALGCSCVIEVLQLITARGLCEFDDVIHNCLGTFLGILAVKVVILIRKKKDSHNEYSFYWSGQKN